MNELSVAQPEEANASLWRRLCAHNGSQKTQLTKPTVPDLLQTLDDVFRHSSIGNYPRYFFDVGLMGDIL